MEVQSGLQSKDLCLEGDRVEKGRVEKSLQTASFRRLVSHVLSCAPSPSTESDQQDISRKDKRRLARLRTHEMPHGRSDVA